jgi:hypothetical protein
MQGDYLSGYQGLSFLSETASPKRRCSKRDLEILASRWSAARPRRVMKALSREQRLEKREFSEKPGR